MNKIKLDDLKNSILSVLTEFNSSEERREYYRAKNAEKNKQREERRAIRAEIDAATARNMNKGGDGYQYPGTMVGAPAEPDAYAARAKAIDTLAQDTEFQKRAAAAGVRVGQGTGGGVASYTHKTQAERDAAVQRSTQQLRDEEGNARLPDFENKKWNPETGKYDVPMVGKNTVSTVSVQQGPPEPVAGPPKPIEAPPRLPPNGTFPGLNLGPLPDIVNPSTSNPEKASYAEVLPPVRYATGTETIQNKKNNPSLGTVDDTDRYEQLQKQQRERQASVQASREARPPESAATLAGRRARYGYVRDPQTFDDLQKNRIIDQDIERAGPLTGYESPAEFYAGRDRRNYTSDWREADRRTAEDEASEKIIGFNPRGMSQEEVRNRVLERIRAEQRARIQPPR